MSNPWFRAYADLIDDPKFIKLRPDLARALLMMWCVACQNDGRLPPLEDIAIKFRMSEARTQKVLDELRHCGWIDDDETGAAPHNWNARQYKSDVSTGRVKQFRKRQRNVSSTVSETPPDTDSEQKQNRTDSEARASAAPAAAVDVVEPVDEDPKAKLYRVAKTILVSFGVAEKRTGALIGQWLKQRSDPVGLLAAIQYARDQNVADPVAYVSTLVHGSKNGHGKQQQSLGDLARELADEVRERERQAGIG